jgi:hypothetical protein
MPRELTETYSPPWCPHFLGRYEPQERLPDGRPGPQRFTVECRVCGASWAGTCESGMVQQRIAKLAAPHLHRDPLKTTKTGFR